MCLKSEFAMVLVICYQRVSGALARSLSTTYLLGEPLQVVSVKLFLEFIHHVLDGGSQLTYGQCL